MKQYSVLILGFLATTIAGCDSSTLKGGTDQVATQCLAFSNAVPTGNQFRHTVHNTCDKTVQALEDSTKQRFTILARGNIVVNLASSTPQMGACYDPYKPAVSSDNKFKCEKP